MPRHPNLHLRRIEGTFHFSLTSIVVPSISPACHALINLENFSMPNYRRNYVPGGTYFFTLFTFKRKKYFDTSTKLDLLHSKIR